MLNAEVNGKKAGATRRTKGICPYCKTEVVPRCGKLTIPHWIHKNNEDCDSWDEKETRWHLMWKNYFPANWQEIIKHDPQTGEKHIADICTDNGFILEFQHFPIKIEEHQYREKFYKNMNWVINETRQKNAFGKFKEGIENAEFIAPITCCQGKFKIQLNCDKSNCEIAKTPLGSILKIYFADKLFYKKWLNSRVVVIFDFKGLNEIENPDDLRQYLFCLLPLKDSFHRYVIQIPIQTFIQAVKNGVWEDFIDNCMNELQKYIQHNKQTTQQAQLRNLYHCVGRRKSRNGRAIGRF